MNNVSNYVWGNNAIKIVNKRGKIKIIDVKKEAVKKKKVRTYVSFFTSSFLLACILVISCFSIVNLQSKQVLLSKQVYKLNMEVVNLESENKNLINQINNKESVDYNLLYQKALKLGMTFPKKKNVYKYKSTKSSLVRIKSPKLLN